MTHELSYKQLKTCNDARISEEQRTENRKRNILLLILNYLQEDGYLNTLEVLENEAGVSLKKFEICDNIDLQTIIQEYESYFYVKFNKWPKISKRVKENHAIDSRRATSSKYASAKPPMLNKRSNTVHLPSIGSSSDFDASTKKRPSSDIKLKKYKAGSSQDISSSLSSETSLDNDISLNGTKVPGLPGPAVNNKKEKKVANDERLLKPFAGYAGLSAEYRELAAVVSRDIYLENPNVYWNDIIGLKEAKRLVKESVVYPIRYPQLFTGILSPWKGLLLYGPPGTGKTLLAKAVATECNTTFFNISASTIVSKWRGDSEKLVRVLFELARFHAPSTIFLDELDSVMGQRGSSGGNGEHEGSRRMKTELLVQMDGLSKSDDLVFLLAASNLPWELDHAMLRRLEKRILVDLPTKDARKLMIEHYLPTEINTDKNGLQLKTDLDYELLAGKLDGYSGSDIRLVCKEAAMKPVRKIFDILDRPINENDELPEFNIDPVRTIDVESALQHTKPSARNLQANYEKWQDQYESV